MEGWVDLGVGYIPRLFTCWQIVTHLSSNQLIAPDWESNPRPRNRKSDVLTVTLPTIAMEDKWNSKWRPPPFFCPFWSNGLFPVAALYITAKFHSSTSIGGWVIAVCAKIQDGGRRHLKLNFCLIKTSLSVRCGAEKRWLYKLSQTILFALIAVVYLYQAQTSVKIKVPYPTWSVGWMRILFSMAVMRRQTYGCLSSCRASPPLVTGTKLYCLVNRGTSRNNLTYRMCEQLAQGC